jgi:hypothetical protein
MHIQLLTVDFHLEACRSLKEKRRRLSGIKEKLGKRPHLACCESDYHDVHQRAQWSFVAVANKRDIALGMLDKVEAFLDEEMDAVIANSYREAL